MRILYALNQSIKQRACLKKKHHQAINTILNLTAHDLQQRKIKILALDFDGVLSAHAAREPLAECVDWLKHFVTQWPEEHIVILSNKPQQSRIDFFKAHFPKIELIVGVRKKPYPDGLLKILRFKKCSAHQLLLVDDRILTGMLSCCLSGTQGLLILKPYRNPHNFFVEAFFSTLRKVERFFF